MLLCWLVRDASDDSKLLKLHLAEHFIECSCRFHIYYIIKKKSPDIIKRSCIVEVVDMELLLS